MSHSHDHAHSHVPALDLNSKKLRNAFYIGIFLNSAFVIIEAGVGWSQNSLALLSDAGHNLSDVVSLILALIAFKLMYSKIENHQLIGDFFDFIQLFLLIMFLN